MTGGMCTGYKSDDVPRPFCHPVVFKTEARAWYIFFVLEWHQHQPEAVQMDEGQRICVPPDLQCLRLNMHVCYQKGLNRLKFLSLCLVGLSVVIKYFMWLVRPPFLVLK